MIRTTGQSRFQSRLDAEEQGDRKRNQEDADRQRPGDLPGQARLAAVGAPGVAGHDDDRNEQEQRPPVARQRRAEIADEEERADADQHERADRDAAAPAPRSRRWSPFG